MAAKRGAWGKGWSRDEESSLLEEKAEGLSLKEIAEKHERTENAILLRLGLIASKKPESYPYIEPEIVQNYKDWKEKKSEKSAEKRAKKEAEEKPKDSLGMDLVIALSTKGLESLKDNLNEPIGEMKKSLRQLVYELDSRENPQTIEEYEELLKILFGATKNLAQQAAIIQTHVSLAK